MFALANSEDAVLLKLKNIGKIYDSNDRDSKNGRLHRKNIKKGVCNGKDEKNTFYNFCKFALDF